MSTKIFNHLLNIKLDAKPASTGQFVSRLQSFESVREFFTGSTIAAIVDFPFVIIFLIVIFFIAGPLMYITVITIIISLVVSWYLQKPLTRGCKIFVFLISRHTKLQMLQYALLAVQRRCSFAQRCAWWRYSF